MDIKELREFAELLNCMGKTNNKCTTGPNLNFIPSKWDKNDSKEERNVIREKISKSKITHNFYPHKFISPRYILCNPIGNNDYEIFLLNDAEEYIVQMENITIEPKKLPDNAFYFQFEKEQ